LQLCGMTQALGNKYPGALVNAVQPLVICEFGFIIHQLLPLTMLLGGQSLKTPEEQEGLIHMLEQLEQVTTLTTSPGIASLRHAWSSHHDT
jgi:hypothetical protein